MIDGRPISIVLGAGGPLGWVFHLGVMRAVAETLGTDVAGADRVIGTSAGAAIAGACLSGADESEIVEAITARPSEDEIERMRELMAEFRRPWRRLRPGAVGAIPRALSRGPATVPATAVVGLLPSGVFPTSSLRRFPAPPDNGRWPPQLWIPSVRLGDATVTVFGRDRLDIPVADAMEASSAVPGMFRPKVIDGQRYVDGAVRSASNADLLAASDPGFVVISSPMTRPGRGVVRSRARRQLGREVKRLRSGANTVVVIEPDADIVTRAEGFPRHNPDRADALIEAARSSSRHLLDRAIALLG